MPQIHLADAWQPKLGVPYIFKHYPPRREELEALPAEQLAAWAEAMPQLEKAGKVDPIEWGFILPSWQEVMNLWGKYHTFVLLGGNRSSKSTLCGRLAVASATQIPGARIRCWSTNEDSSINDQQKIVWEAVPERYKALRQTRAAIDHSVQFSQKNGFSGNKVIFPPCKKGYDGGEMIFQTYKSYANDPQIAEGWWAHLVWGDEEMPQKLFETLQYRLRDARGRLFLSFTTLQGWTPLVADILGKTRTLRRRYSTLLKRELPVMQESLSRPGTLIIYFWTEDNAFFLWEDLIANLVARPEEEKLARAHGIPTRATGSAFPLFDEDVHVVPHEQLPWIRERRTKDGKALPAYKVTRYMALDPAGRKNWFMLWAAVDEADTVWVYREWPDESYGDWAEPANDAKGKAGPAQRGQGFGIRDYTELIHDLEDGEPIFERVIDSRLGTAEKQSKEGATSIQTELEDEGFTFIAAPGLDIEHGIQLINDRLAYDNSQPVSSTNAPKLYISDRCKQLIFAMKNFTGKGGKDEACKDPADCLRYLLENGIEHFEAKETEASHVGSY